MSAFQRKYGTATVVRIPLLQVGTTDQALTANWTPAAGDVKISKDGGTTANIGTLPTFVAMGSLAGYWVFTIASGEATCASAIVTIADANLEDDAFVIETYGNASAMHPGVYVAVGGIVADSLDTTAVDVIGDAVGAYTLDAFTVDHDTAGTVGKAILDASTGGASAVAALGTLATAVGLLPTLAEILAANADLAGTSPGGGSDDELVVADDVVNDQCNGWLAILVSGTGAVEAQVVEDTVGSTNTLVFASDWTTTPDATTEYVVLQIAAA